MNLGSIGGYLCGDFAVVMIKAGRVQIIIRVPSNVIIIVIIGYA